MLDGIITATELEKQLLERYFSKEETEDGAYLNEINYFIAKDKDIEYEYILKCDYMEKIALGKENMHGVNELDMLEDRDGPKIMKKGEISEEAKEMREKLEAARKNKDADLLGSLIFDAECEDMAEMIDL